jgi:hypothetical protein
MLVGVWVDNSVKAGKFYYLVFFTFYCGKAGILLSLGGLTIIKKLVLWKIYCSKTQV